MLINKKLNIIIILVISSIFLNGCYDTQPVEQLGLSVGIGYDIEKKGGTITYIETLEQFLYKGDNKIENDVITGKSTNVYATETDAQSKYPKRLALGAEIAYVLGEERAKLGIKDIIDSFTRNPARKETAIVVVSKQDAKDVLNGTPVSESTISEEIQSMIHISYVENFFSKENEVYHLLQMYYSEGQSIVIPYLEIVDGKINLAGLALFKDDKMVNSVNMEEAQLINLLRNERGTSTMGISSKYADEDNDDEYNIFCKSRRKVKVYKENDILNYNIIINLNADLIGASKDNRVLSAKDVPMIQNTISEYLEYKLNGQIEKMQNEYETDWIDITKYALAKFGRNSGYDSDDMFKNAKINVEVKTKVSSLGQMQK